MGVVPIFVNVEPEVKERLTEISHRLRETQKSIVIRLINAEYERIMQGEGVENGKT